MTPPVLHTARLTLMPASPAHAEAFNAFCATEGSRFNGGPAERRDAWQGAAIGAGLWAVRDYGPFGVTAADEPVGRVGVYYPDWRAEPELARVNFPAHQGQGFAAEAALAARDSAQRELGLGALRSLIDAKIAPSIREAEKPGAVQRGPHDPNSRKPIMCWRHPGAESGQAPTYGVAP